MLTISVSGVPQRAGPTTHRLYPYPGRRTMLNRLERVGETLRFALNGLAAVAPEWLQT